MPNVFELSGNPQSGEDRMTHALISTLAQADRRVLGAFLEIVTGGPVPLGCEDPVDFSLQVVFDGSRPDALIATPAVQVVIEAKRFQALCEPQFRQHYANVLAMSGRRVLLAVTNAVRPPPLVATLARTAPPDVDVRHVSWSEIVAMAEALAPGFAPDSATRLLLVQLDTFLRGCGYRRREERLSPAGTKARVGRVPPGSTEQVRFHDFLQTTLRKEVDAWLERYGRPELRGSLRYRARKRSGTQHIEFEQLETRAIAYDVASVRFSRAELGDPDGPVHVTMSMTHSIDRPDEMDVLGRNLPLIKQQLTRAGANQLLLDPREKPKWRAATIDYGEFQAADLKTPEMIAALAEELARLVVAWAAMRR